LREIRVYVQMYPGTAARAGVDRLEYSVTVGDAPPVQGHTGSDGMISIRLAPGATAALRVLGSTYDISLTDELHPIEEMRGVQQRLAMLGYCPGPLKGDDARADTYVNPDAETERAILDFQADKGLFADAQFGPTSSRSLRRVVRDARGE
jgi:peptidoglycan hydrolase-like protein with peptidoglycan-binding domain